MARPGCSEQIQNEVNRGYADVDPNQLMRATRMPASGEAQMHLSAGGCSPGSFVLF